MFDVSSVSAIFTAFIGNVSTILGTVLTAVLGILAALLGLGYAVRHVKRWITGRKA